MNITQAARDAAAKLTEAQKRAMLAMTDRWQRPSKSTFSHGAAWGACWGFTPPIVDRCRIGKTAARAHDEFRLTPLGQQVAAILKGAS